MNKDDVFAALDRLENDALASRDGYGDARKDAEIIRAALTAKQSINAQLVEALKDARSVINSINYGKNHAIKQHDGEVVFGQTGEWCKWVLFEQLPKIEQAIAAAEAQPAQTVDVEDLKKDTSNTQELLAKCEDFTVGYNTGWNAAIDAVIALRNTTKE